MAEGIKPIRRVVTGNDERGRSRVLYDGPAPRVKGSAFKKGTGMTDIWMYESSPAPLGGDRDGLHVRADLLGGVSTTMRSHSSALRSWPSFSNASKISSRSVISLRFFLVFSCNMPAVARGILFFMDEQTLKYRAPSPGYQR